LIYLNPRFERANFFGARQRALHFAARDDYCGEMTAPIDFIDRSVFALLRFARFPPDFAAWFVSGRRRDRESFARIARNAMVNEKFRARAAVASEMGFAAGRAR